MTTSTLQGLPRLSPSSNLPSHVHAALQEAILSGALPPGERLFVDEVAAHFGVSKIPVREALKALEVEGWVQSRPRRGTYVRPLDRSHLQEIFEMRRVLEPYSAGLAAVRRSEAQLRELRGLLSDTAQALKVADVLAVSSLNSQFHSVMADAAGNSLMSEAIGRLELQLRRYFIAVEWQQRRESMAQHKAIFEALKDKNAKLAEKLTLEHIDHTEALAQDSIMHTLAEAEPTDAP
jgi:DNA-binding GntR family transcriptional regulator